MYEPYDNTEHSDTGISWEVYLIARKFDWSGRWLRWRPTNWGHAWVAVVPFEMEKQSLGWLQNRAQELKHVFWPSKDASDHARFRLSSEFDIRTYSRWTDGWHYNNRLDIEGTRKIIETGRIDFLDVAIRKARVSSQKVDWIDQIARDARATGCGTERYGFWCLCTTYAGNLWNRVTSEKLRLPPTPNDTVNYINYLNRKQGSQYAFSGELIR